MTFESPQCRSPWPHRWAVALACATFPLLWVGGLVTTTDAGMAVPDWPNTYGYNLFLYPISTWLSGPWDIFVEHGHRLLGALVGMISIGLLVVLWRNDRRRWMSWLGAAALALVVFQGVLGGMRVVLNERTLAMLHGCTGPLFFALTVALAVFTSRRWQGAREPLLSPHGGTIRRLAVVTCILVYLQLLLGAVLRHVPIATEPGTFALAVKFHLFMAGVLLFHIALLAWASLRDVCSAGIIHWLAAALAGLMCVQLALGAATWLAKYSVPYWASGFVPANWGAIVDKGWLQTHIVTAHVAVGSMMLGVSLALALYALRLLSAPVTRKAGALGRVEAAL